MAAEDLIPDSEGAGRFLPWVVAVMVFFAALAALAFSFAAICSADIFVELFVSFVCAHALTAKASATHSAI